jgi:tRNA A-37 threonylcarbamoyl transferase component Bud32
VRGRFRGNERYEILRRVGAGGMGVVYQALDRERNAKVALKTLRHVDAASIYRFKGEFRALADVSHTNLAALHELQCVEGQWFFTMEFVEGINFLAYVRRGYELSQADTLDMAPATLDERLPTQLDVSRLRDGLEQLAEGVAALHQAGKLHRDIKPSNVLVTASGRVVLLDFGLVTDAMPSSPHVSVESLVGTAAYMAPEQAMSAPLTPASDWYAVGVMLYEALTGKLPFDGSALEIMMKKQEGEPPSPRALAPDVPADLDVLCRELLQRRPEARPPASEIQRRLGARTATSRPPRRSSSAATRLVGREQQLGQLFDAFAESAAQATAVLVHGSSGMGKSALVRRFLELTRADALVLSGRCYERESVPYKGFDRLIDELSTYLLGLATPEVQALLPRDVAAVARVFPVLRRVTVLANARRLEPDIPDAQELRRRAFAGLRELLARLAQRRRLVLYVDDLQWGDLDSGSLLAELLHPPDAPPLLFIGCYRSEDAASVMVRGLPRGPGVHEIAVDQLSHVEARELALALLDHGGGRDEAAAEIIARESGGSPFFVGELVRYVEAGAGMQPGDLTLESVLALRVAKLPDPARRLLQVLALHGRPLPAEPALRAADLVPGDDSPLAQLRVSNLVRTRGVHGHVEPSHDRIRETVAALIPADEARLRHARLAATLEAYGAADPESLAVHYRGAGDLERAGEWAQVAAAQAAEMLAFDRAARLYRLSLEYRPQSRELRVKLGDALVNAGRGAEAARAYLAARDDASPVEARVLARRAAEQFLFSGHVDEGRKLMGEVLRGFGMDLPRSQRRSLLLLVAGRIRVSLRGFHFHERAAAAIAPEQLERIDACWSAAHGFGMIDVLLSQLFHTRHLLLALEAGEPVRVARGLAIEPTTASAGGNFSRSDALVAQAQALADRLGNAHAQGLVAMEAATVWFMRGEFRRARELFERAEQLFRDRCTGVAAELATTYALKLYSHFYLGELTTLAQMVPDHMRQAEERGDLFAVLSAKVSYSNIYWLIGDDAEGARREADDALLRWSSDGFHVQHFASLTAQVHIDLYRSDGPAAWQRVQAQWKALTGSILYRVQSSRMEAHSLRGRAALAAAQATQANAAARAKLLAVVEEQARAFVKAKLRHTGTLAALLRAGAAATVGNRARALELLDAAIAAADANDLALHAATARYRKGQLTGDTAQRTAALDFLRRQRVHAPERFFAMLAPGFSDDAA